MIDELITKFKDTGICKVDIDLVCKKWNHLFFITQWEDEFRLIKQKRKDSPITALKITVSELQARQIIERLNLKQTKSMTFRSGSTWR